MRIKVGVIILALVCGGLLTARAADEKSDSKGKARLNQPWSKISSLSDDQKSQIMEIHKKAIDEKKAIAKREHDEIMAVLNDDQKKEAEALDGAKTTKKKSDESAPTSAPAQ